MKAPGYIFAEALRNLIKKRATVLYPYREVEKIHLPDGFRGKIEFDRPKCIGCQMCFRVCPAKAIEIIEDERGKRPIFLIYRCIYCGQCAEVCPTKAITLGKVFENVALRKEELEVR
ncbi:MAG: 4Fe-4S dicluster domain-containing protein [Nitrososphaeria archaeon]|nr:4Fe-4S dicluster domain-containing protein [Aigarchaeota archaeon]MCX8187925.1 4Fe-4S dicluster domain-containing protein [Nitrososphaeria archaeon]MDW8021227.1 4Fe-4S dicluster domain-containing protein [Nitrososphaerota archaeon]